MASMTFKCNLLPNSTSLGYSLGDSTYKWNIYGTLHGNADTATKLSNTPNNTTTFLRGDNTWTNTLLGDFYCGIITDTDVRRCGVRSSTGSLQISSNPITNTRYLYAIDSNNVGSSVIEVSANNNTRFYGTLYGTATNCVEKTGDTMTGILWHNIPPAICYTNITRGTAPVNDNWKEIFFSDSTKNLNFADNAGRLGSLTHYVGPNWIATYLTVNSNTTTNRITSIGVLGYNDGTFRGYCDAPFYGAVWNDYAEFRETKNIIEPGRCIKEIGDDTLELTTKRLERGCEIVSDTFGFAIGESEKCKTPTAASGRVLAYLYEDREKAKNKIGWPVCSGPNGTVSIMSEEEEEKYPSRIIGTISAVPDYDIWYAGSNGDTPIKVNGRIWIRIR